MTDEQFAEFCAEHPDLMFEMTAEGELIVMAPTFSMTGSRNANIIRQLGTWADRDGRGIVNDSSTGYVLPNSSRRSPDASWVAKDRIKLLSEKSLQGFWHLCPAFVIELRTESDRVGVLRAKMDEYIANGALLGWLIDPIERKVHVYRPETGVEILDDPTQVSGDPILKGFTIDLSEIWN